MKNLEKGFSSDRSMMGPLNLATRMEFSSTSGTSFEVEAAMIPASIRNPAMEKIRIPTIVASRLLRKFFISLFF
jgi:hypothetical protein